MTRRELFMAPLLMFTPRQNQALTVSQTFTLKATDLDNPIVLDMLRSATGKPLGPCQTCGLYVCAGCGS